MNENIRETMSYTAWKALVPYPAHMFLPTRCYCARCNVEHAFDDCLRQLGRTGKPVLKCPRCRCNVWATTTGMYR